jgi:hypothetical protein
VPRSSRQHGDERFAQISERSGAFDGGHGLSPESAPVAVPHETAAGRLAVTMIASPAL